MLLHASQAAAEAQRTNKIVMVIEMNGGNDGLNTVIPFEDAAYHEARPSLGIQEGIHRLDDQFALHPAMESLSERFKEGEMGIVHGVGYPNPNESHFRSMEIWQTGDPATVSSRDGWLGRYLDQVAKNDRDGIPGVAFGERLPQSLMAREANIPVIAQLANYGIFVEAPEDGRIRKELIEKLPTMDAHPENRNASALDFLRKQARDTYAGAERLRAAAQSYQPRGDYIGELGNQMRMATQLIAADMGTQVFHASIEGFDTHANQAGLHSELLGQLSHNVGSFLDEIDAMGRGDDLIVMTYSEFGRRVHENGSVGTDHGTAAPMFLFGKGVKGGFHGEHPSLTDLEMDNLEHTTDFRSVYATVLEDWLGASSREILGEQFSKLDLISTPSG